MINWRLIRSVPGAKRSIFWIVLLNSGALLMQGLFLMGIMLWIKQDLVLSETMVLLVIGCLLLILIKNWLQLLRHRLAVKLSNHAKMTLRSLMINKLSQLSPSTVKRLNHAEIGQLMTEGIDQCELYFGSYVPQFFYAFLAPLILSVLVSQFSVKVAWWLLVCVPLIPIAIMAVQKLAKRLLARYWGYYTNMSDNFLDRLKGLKTLKIFDVDGQVQTQINEDAEVFRKATMRVLVMQLNSISIMDWVAYGGACGGILIALGQYHQGALTFATLIFVILVSAEFFIPMRQLGSFFHVAMNGAQAARRIFDLLDLEDSCGINEINSLDEGYHLNMVQAYYDDNHVLKDLSLEFDFGEMIGLVGKSGSGKSTLVSLLAGFKTDYNGQLTLNHKDLASIQTDSLYQHVCYVGGESTVFVGSFRQNLDMDETHSDHDLYHCLFLVGLDDMVKKRGGLDATITSSDQLSVGQKQRLCLARALCNPKEIFIFDEITSGVDVESEQIILDVIHSLKDKKRCIVLVSHRLKSVQNCDKILVLDQGSMVGYDKHDQLLNTCPVYQDLVSTQAQYEQFFEGANHEARF